MYIYIAKVGLAKTMLLLGVISTRKQSKFRLNALHSEYVIVYILKINMHGNLFESYKLR